MQQKIFIKNCNYDCWLNCKYLKIQFNRIEYLHENNFIFRDLKPENFLVGLGKKADMIYIIDFGLCKKFRD